MSLNPSEMTGFLFAQAFAMMRLLHERSAYKRNKSYFD